MFSGVVFDMDGLLLDSERPIRDAWVHVAAQFDVELTADVYLQWVGRREADVRKEFGDYFGPRLPFAEACERVRTRVSEHYAEEGYQVKAGAHELLNFLNQRGIPCAVASSTRHTEVHRRLKNAELREFFVSISGGDEVANGKPHPDLFLLAAKRLGIAPQSCLVFEDSEYGAQGALAAGMSVVIVPDLKTPNPAIADQCIAVLESLAHAQSYAEAWFPLSSPPPE
jgi:HAD superfamily hydrolase (TIGR01509 family)